ncbi:MAG: MerR family transcriptional regulator [Vicinamibacterales bacterium]
MPAPKRDLFKAADVCEMAQLQPYVLRSWEAEFPRLGRPAENGSARVYRRGDVELVLRIKQLVFGEGLTLAGARRRLEEENEEPDQHSMGARAVQDALGDVARSRLRQIRSGLEQIMVILSRHMSAPELELVPPGESPRAAGRRASVSTVSGKGSAKAAAKGGAKRGRASA